jgi:hypothetical protein
MRAVDPEQTDSCPYRARQRKGTGVAANPEVIRLAGDRSGMTQTIIDEEFADNIVTTARTATGDSLRSVTYFTRANFQQLYLRDDLEQDADLNTFVGHEWQGYKQTENAYRESELGEYKFTIRAFENGYLLRVTGDRAGVLITTDGLAMNSYEEIAEALDRMLEEETEDE